MLWTLALIIFFAAVTAALARTFRERRHVPDRTPSAAFHEALRRLAALSSGPVPTGPIARREPRACASCGSLIPFEHDDDCVVCAMGGSPARDRLVPLAVERGASRGVSGRR
ncbi:MAG: hypothetical protein HZB56_08315 [Deltaproteobacteria bacterium]|nr:hypothetical protein [Deltaproteobacteria bacterium]